ncbi:MAG: hypothetical protein ACQEW8_10795 [Actinomycetota bacterium]
MDHFDTVGESTPPGSSPVLRAARRSGARWGAGLIVAVAAFTLSGCTTPGHAYAVLDRDAQPTDAVPDDLPPHAWRDADPASARSVGEHDGTSLWLARGTDEAGTCLLAYADEEAWVISCGGEGAPFVLGGVAGSFTVVPDGSVVPDGATEISENVYTFS